MSSFVPGHFGEYPPPFGEELSHPERPQDQGQTNLVISEILQVAVHNSVPDPLNDTLQALGEEPSHPGQPQGPEETHIVGVQQVVITAIRATDLTLGLRCIPAGFHVVIKTDSAECQTSNKPVHINQAVVEWNGPILLFGSAFMPHLSWVPYSVMEKPSVHSRSQSENYWIAAKNHIMLTSIIAIIFQPKQEEVVSACTSLFITLEQQLFDENNAAVLCPLTTLTSRDMDALALRTDSGHRLLARYRRTQNSRDLYQSIKHFERASDLCPMDHPYRSAALFNLATTKFVSCQADGRYLDLDIPINLFQDALNLCPTDHPDRTVTQLHLAIALLSRFVKRGCQTDADAAEELLSEVVDVCHADSHIYRAALIAIKTSALHSAGSIDVNDLGQERPAASMLPLSPNQLAHLAERCLQRDEPHALEEVISLHYDALGYYNTGHALRGQLLGNLGLMLETRFKHRGSDEDLDQAIAFHGETLALHPAIALQREALALCPVGHTDRSKSLSNLAVQLFTRFEHRGNDEDLDQAITLDREALVLHPVGHTDRSLSLSNLANQLSTRFQHRGNDEDLDQAITLDSEALVLRPIGHTNRSESLHNLANQLSTRFQHRGNDDDLDQAIALQREVLALRPVGHTDWSRSLNNLVAQLFTCFDHRGNDEDLDQAIALAREALALWPVGHTKWPLSLNNLVIQLFTRFEHRGNNEDLDQAIALHREALALRPVGHTDRSSSLGNLASHLCIRFEHRGNDKDLDQAIALQRESLALHPVGHADRHTDRSKSLNSLANRLSTRFYHRGNDDNLDQAIALQREALALCPVGHTDRSWLLTNLGNRLFTRLEHRGTDKDLDQATTLYREALALCPVGHTDQFKALNTLSNQLSTRFEHRGNDKDLNQAIALQREALALCPVGHTYRSGSLSNLAHQLSTRFDCRGDREDLNESRENLHCALTLLTQHDPFQVNVHVSLAIIYLSFHRSGLDSTGAGKDSDSLNAAMHHFKAAVNVVSAGLVAHLQASLRWVNYARQYLHDTELEAHATSMQLLDTHMTTTASASSRHNIMKDFPSTLAMDAASCALGRGDVCRAVELLEQGRTIIWTQMTRLRTPLDSFQTRGDHAAALMKKFRDLSSLLNKPPANYPEANPRVDVEAEETRYRHLVKDWNRTVEDIRKIESFSRFLLPPLFSDLQDAARDGPIIVLIASKSSCDAIIIPHKQPPTSIQLPINWLKLIKLVVAVQEAINKEAGPKRNQSALIKVLRKLWDNVVRPVVENLGRFAQQESLSQQYISSYTPLLTALMKAHRSHDRSPSVSFAAIGQNLPAGHSSTLDGVEPELELVQSLLPPPPTVSFTKIMSIDATKRRALRALQDNTWLHFACHGTQKYDEPFKSAFLMRDHPLSLLDITQMDLSRHQFAFLSACETAVGDFSTPDEVIHLAAGLQFAGVNSVVGTLWNVNDSTVQCLVAAFYKNLCGDGTMNSKRAARALH
ncbi:CHAT domain-containing protein [Suillus subalutaceus]|uniref:CHAT domain-containing protein n=1 Tax=Suillus subalutaceus TaxID=48586 RepID=UPI001B8641DA|nr:CHAT domain-containing protein [Suillus subalutaceus]KAG1840297.1 CHAT domain-containing protein [Suillus subalutaceus]